MRKIKQFLQQYLQIFKDKLPALKKIWPLIKKNFTGTQGIVLGTVIFSFLFLTVIIVQSCTPRKGTILYGMCGSFLEQQVIFPETIQHSTVEQYRKAVRIYFTHIDGFGEYQLEFIECSFFQDPAQGVQMESVYFDSVKDVTQKERAPGKGRLYKVEQKYIDLFNRSQSPKAIVYSNPNLELPRYNQVTF